MASPTSGPHDENNASQNIFRFMDQWIEGFHYLNVLKLESPENTPLPCDTTGLFRRQIIDIRRLVKNHFQGGHAREIKQLESRARMAWKSTFGVSFQSVTPSVRRFILEQDRKRSHPKDIAHTINTEMRPYLKGRLVLSAQVRNFTHRGRVGKGFFSPTESSPTGMRPKPHFFELSEKTDDLDTGHQTASSETLFDEWNDSESARSRSSTFSSPQESPKERELTEPPVLSREDSDAIAWQYGLPTCKCSPPIL